MNLLRDLHINSKAEVALLPVVVGANGTIVGPIIDTNGFMAAELQILTGVVTDGSHAILLEHGDDSALSDAATMTSDELIGGALVAIVAADDGIAKRQGLIGYKRYVRVSLVSTAITTGGLIGAGLLLSSAKHAPVTDQV